MNDRSLGYEPSGFNLATPPRFKYAKSNIQGLIIFFMRIKKCYYNKKVTKITNS